MSRPDTHDELAAIEEIGAALQHLGASLRRYAEAAARARNKTVHDPATGPGDERQVRLLWKRLGRDNRAFLYAVAEAFPPDYGVFTLDDVAGKTGVEKRTARARLMNIGRSLKGLGADAPELWEATWDGDAGQTIYGWRESAHRAVIATGGGT